MKAVKPLNKAAAVILAAGSGKRMKSDKPKVLHEVAGRPMIAWVCSAASSAGCDPVVVVVGHGREAVEAKLPSGVRTAIQEQPLGTAHAVICAREALKGSEAGLVVVLCGDVPLIRPKTIRRLVARAASEDASCVLLTMTVEGPHAYGRIVRGGGGRVERIVEHKDATEAERSIMEVNSGAYCFRAADLFDTLGRVGNDNKAGEYYLTDVVGMLTRSGRKVLAEEVEDPRELTGVDSPEALDKVRSLASCRPQL